MRRGEWEIGNAALKVENKRFRERRTKRGTFWKLRAGIPSREEKSYPPSWWESFAEALERQVFTR
jgi:hypothetical protein